MTIECRPLFASNLFVKKIDPTLFNKEEIISSVIKNYDLKKTRNEWDDISTLHHYYNDWDNPIFEKINLDSVVKIYHSIYEEILNEMFSKYINFKVIVENITVYKGATDFMAEHNHVGDGIFFSGVHYIKCNDQSPMLTFVNPLIYSKYPNLSVQNLLEKRLDNSNLKNSVHFLNWGHKVKEDEMIIFPQFLNHKVEACKIENSEHRIAIVTNLRIF